MSKSQHYTITAALKSWLAENGFGIRANIDAAADDVVRQIVAQALLKGSLAAEKFVELVADPDPATKAAGLAGTKAAKLTGNPDKLFGGGSGSATIRVKAPSEQYSEVRHSAKHAKLGRPVLDGYGNEATLPSQRSLAKSGAFLKHAARRAGLPVQWNEHDQALLTESVENDDWCDFNGEPHENKIYSGGSVKAPLLDESGTSGGLYVTPIEFDSDVIQFPLLNNEFFPLVDLKPVARGRRIESGSVGNPTVNWGGGDGASPTVFDSTALVAALNTSIYVVDCFLTVGRDFLQDAAVNVGSILTENIGQKLATALDDVILSGNGSTQPAGIFGASGTTSVSFGSTTATVTGYESLLFAVAKQYRMPAGSNFVFGSNETSYRRARSIAVSGSDQRRVFGMDHESYSMLARPYKINHALPNTKIMAGAMSKYRMYRRLGMSVEWHTQGSTLALSNEALLVVRARYGGRVMDPAAFAVVTDAAA